MSGRISLNDTYLLFLSWSPQPPAHRAKSLRPGGRSQRFLGFTPSTIESKESRPIVDPALVCGEGPGFGLPPGRGLSMTLLCSTYLWSLGVMEYWKNEIPTPTFCNFKQRASRISEVKSASAIDHHSSTPILHHSLKLLQAEPIISDLAQRTRISKFD